MDIVDPRIEDYMRTLLTRYDEPVLLEMEAEGKERGFPIIGRLVGVTVELLARSIGARRVFELGSGFGYSAYWFSRAVGPGGEVHATDGDPANERKALGYLARAGLAEPIRWHVGDAVENLASRRGRVRRRLRRHRQGGVPRRVAGGSRTDPRGRALRLRQRAVVGRVSPTPRAITGATRRPRTRSSSTTV